MADGQDEGDFVYLGVEDALEIYAAIFDLTPVQAVDHLRSREALEGRWAVQPLTRIIRRPTSPCRRPSSRTESPKPSPCRREQALRVRFLDGSLAILGE